MLFTHFFRYFGQLFRSLSPRSAAQHKTQYLVVCFAPTAMLFSSGTPARRSSPQVEISLEKSVFFAFFPTFKALQSML